MAQRKAQMEGESMIAERADRLASLIRLSYEPMLAWRPDGPERGRWLASTIDSSDDAIVGKTLGGVITSWNRGAQRVYGSTAEAAIGQPITIVIPKDRQVDDNDSVTDPAGKRIDHFETVRERKDGCLIVVSLTGSSVKSANGDFVGTSKTARDMPSDTTPSSTSPPASCS
jgi:PAS domain S-box-containing protein